MHTGFLLFTFSVLSSAKIMGMEDWRHCHIVIFKFLDFSVLNASQGDQILCPCKNCSNLVWDNREVVYEHLVCEGFEHLVFGLVLLQFLANPMLHIM